MDAATAADARQESWPEIPTDVLEIDPTLMNAEFLG